MNIQWYPGHMTKAKRAMQEDIKLVDLVIELVDARLPQSSRNPDIDRLGANKARLILLNKADLADERMNLRWKDYFKANGCDVVILDARNNNGMKPVRDAIALACKEKTERDRKRGILNRPVRAMVAGIPNVGKSTFINSLVKRSAAKTGNKPGVTKGNQWIKLGGNVELLDTPGVLWPKFEDEQVGIRLALVGSINDQILDIRELACEGIRFFRDRYPGTLAGRYGLADEDMDPYAILEAIAVARKALKKGSLPDVEKASALFLEDLRSGRLGRITLESPEEYNGEKTGC